MTHVAVSGLRRKMWKVVCAKVEIEPVDEDVGKSVCGGRKQAQTMMKPLSH